MKRVLIDPLVDVSILYYSAFKEMDFNLYINPHLSYLKSFDNNLASATGAIWIRIKLGNNDESDIHFEET